MTNHTLNNCDMFYIDDALYLYIDDGTVAPGLFLLSAGTTEVAATRFVGTAGTGFGMRQHYMAVDRLRKVIDSTGTIFIGNATDLNTEITSLVISGGDPL